MHPHKNPASPPMGLKPAVYVRAPANQTVNIIKVWPSHSTSTNRMPSKGPLVTMTTLPAGTITAWVLPLVEIAKMSELSWYRKPAIDRLAIGLLFLSRGDCIRLEEGCRDSAQDGSRKRSYRKHTPIARSCQARVVKCIIPLVDPLPKFFSRSENSCRRDRTHSLRSVRKTGKVRVCCFPELCVSERLLLPWRWRGGCWRRASLLRSSTWCC